MWQCSLRLLGKLKGTREFLVDLNGGRIDLVPDDMQGQLPALLEGVEILSLSGIVCLGGPPALQGILLACSRLSHLYLNGVCFADDVSPYHLHDATANHKETLRTFVYYGDDDDPSEQELLRWLAHGGMNFRPSRLGFTTMTEGICDMLHSAGDSLEYLWVDLSEPIFPPMAPALACNTRLASIDILYFNPRLIAAWRVLSVLSSIGATNTSMQQLGLSVIGPLAKLVNASTWREVDSHLARLARSLPALVVTFYFHRCFNDDDQRGKIIEILDNFMLYREARGRLAVCWSATPEQYAKAVDLKLVCQPELDPGLLGSP
ncbi:hypothetical protein WOLCODRAFT_165341 [Wolfiporia cocos MD-104 SS10]|uniref:F-box domain-containing protein n=1 Tax=Wolfiporia cocos (strain MD-104) TaxID=742152 RepID=A0A2H3K3I3_WOLCO|nr:hypothetical protein WOLCODRAFT_165341 [Wolfiporia cocos MD-104 SS10]